MLVMAMPEMTLDPTSAMPLYRQLEDALATAIASGELGVGDRLPSERTLAEQIGVSRTTAVTAYRELEARGLVRGRVGRGTYVCAAGGAEGDAPFAWQGKVTAGAQRTLDATLRSLTRDQPGETISFAGGLAALDRFPVDVFRQSLDRVMDRQLDAVLGLGPTEGQPRLRAELAFRHGVQPEQVLVVAGAQQGLDLISPLPARAGRRGRDEPPRLPGRHPDLPRRRRADGRLGLPPRRRGRAGGPPAALPSEAALPQPDLPQPHRADAAAGRRAGRC